MVWPIIAANLTCIKKATPLTVLGRNAIASKIGSELSLAGWSRFPEDHRWRILGGGLGGEKSGLESPARSRRRARCRVVRLACERDLEHRFGFAQECPLAGRHFVENHTTRNRSVRAFNLSPRTCSEDMYPTVPIAVPVWLACKSSFAAGSLC